MQVLVINCGSSSIKFQVIQTETETALRQGLIERIGIDLSWEGAMDTLMRQLDGVSIEAIGHRVVHGGQTFLNSTQIDDTVISAIEACSPLAPLHNPKNLQGIAGARKAFPGLPQVAVFDTAFHSRMPEHSYRYALPTALADELKIRRYGFHGTSHHYVALKLAEHLQRPLAELKLVSLHLGNGASVCAIEGGYSVDTSMGLTPLEGLIMGTRSGDLDAGAVLRLQQAGSLTLEQVDQVLNRESGLLGLSELSADVRELEQAADAGHPGAKRAIDAFVHRARKYLGAYLAVLKGADAVIFTGGIGENSSRMREKILKGFTYAGLVMDNNANNSGRPSSEAPIKRLTQENSLLQAYSIQTNEELMIARETEALVQ